MLVEILLCVVPFHVISCTLDLLDFECKTQIFKRLDDYGVAFKKWEILCAVCSEMAFTAMNW